MEEDLDEELRRELEGLADADVDFSLDAELERRRAAAAAAGDDASGACRAARRRAPLLPRTRRALPICDLASVVARPLGSAEREARCAWRGAAVGLSRRRRGRRLA